MLLVHEVMTVQPITVTPGTTIGEVMQAFDRHDFNAFPVAEDGELVGIVTKLDLLRALRPAPDFELRGVESVASQRVETIMRRGVVTVEPHDPVLIAADLMVETRLRSLPVVERPRASARVIVGIVTQGDLLRGLRLALADERIAAGLETSGVSRR